MKQVFTIIFLLVTFITLAAGSPTQPYEGWIETETDHFRIIYEEISTESVVEIIGFCEDVYSSVTEFFKSYPEKITIVVHDRIDMANGSFYPVPPHINMYIESPSTPELGAKVDNWLRFLLIHELTHYVNMTIEEGLFYQLSRVMGKSVSGVPGGLMPGWAIEGIAVKLESDFTGGGRGNNPFFEMYSKALIIEDKLFSWKQAAYSSWHPPLSRIYIAGYIINDYMARTYGNDIFVRIYRDYLKFPFLGFNHYVKKITGNSTNEIFSAMESELREKYSELTSLEGKLLSPDEESNYYLPVISDKGWIVYRDTADKEPALVLIDPESRKETTLINIRLSDYRSFSASGEGNIIAFAALEVEGRNPGGLSAVSDLYIINRTRDIVSRITINSHLRQPALSPDGHRLIAVQKSGQYTRLVEVEISNGDVSVIFEKKHASVFSPVFSEDGENIAFSLQDNSGRSIWIVNKEGVPVSITADIPGDDYNPYFHGTDTIVFVSDMDGSPDLYETDTTDRGVIKKVFEDPAGIFEYLVTGKNIIYSTYSHRGYTLKTAPYPEESAKPVGHYYKENETDSAEFSDMGLTHNTDIIYPAESCKNFPIYKNYKDTPKLILFSPLPFYTDPLYDSNQIFGPGFTAYFQSILGKSRISTTVTMNTETLQPGASFNFSYNWGPVLLNYNLLQGYSPVSGIYNASQTTRQQLILNIPVVSRRRLGYSTYFGLFTGINDDFSIISNKDFSFFSPDAAEGIEYSNNIFQINGISLSVTGNQSPKDIIPPLQINSSTSVYSPISQDYFNQYAVKSTHSINLPSPIDHQVFRFGGRLTYSEIENLNHLNNPRGFYLEATDSIEILTSAEYLFTIAVPDLPILSGLSLQGISAAVHLEKILSIENNMMFPDDDLYGGVEFILLGNYINVFETAGLGISYRFEPNSRGFSPGNMGIYMFIGTNSFE
ncbi:MAG: hypothetical protein KAR21_07395 [Spirochaetales bacterium]|nr:hypothetical protein [Spirochaetales bacterium]